MRERDKKKAATGEGDCPAHDSAVQPTLGRPIGATHVPQQRLPTHEGPREALSKSILLGRIAKPRSPDVFTVTQPSSGQREIDSLWYNDLNYAAILEKQMILKKYAENRFTKMNEVGFSTFLDYIMTQSIVI